MQRLQAEFSTSERHACELMSIPRSSCRYRSRRNDARLRELLIELARQKPRFGYRRLHILSVRESMSITNVYSGCIVPLDCVCGGCGASG